MKRKITFITPQVAGACIENRRHQKRYFAPQPDDFYIVITTPTGRYEFNYWYVQDYMSKSERNKVIKLAVKNGGWTLETGGSDSGKENG